MSIFDDLSSEQERLAQILSGLTDAQWLSESGAAGWTVADVVLHLAQSDEGVAATAAGNGGSGGNGGSAAKSVTFPPTSEIRTSSTLRS